MVRCCSLPQCESMLVSKGTGHPPATPLTPYTLPCRRGRIQRGECCRQMPRAGISSQSSCSLVLTMSTVSSHPLLQSGILRLSSLICRCSPVTCLSLAVLPLAFSHLPRSLALVSACHVHQLLHQATKHLMTRYRLSRRTVVHPIGAG